MNKVYNLVRNEVRKELLITWSYRSQWMGEFFSLLVSYVFLNELTFKSYPASALSYCIWFYSIVITGGISNKIASEMVTGTLEQIYLSIIPIPVLFCVKIVAGVIRASLLMIVLCTCLVLLKRASIDFNSLLRLLFIIISITPGLLGLSLLLGGLTLWLKDIGWLINCVNSGLLFVSGIFLPVESLPTPLRLFSQTLPTTQAIGILKNGFSAYLWLNIVAWSFLYCVLGLCVFYRCDKQAKLMGNLAHY